MYNWYITRISASPGDTLIGVERGNPTPLLMIKIKLKLNSPRRHLMNGSDSEPIDCQIPKFMVPCGKTYFVSLFFAEIC